MHSGKLYMSLILNKHAGPIGRHDDHASHRVSAELLPHSGIYYTNIFKKSKRGIKYFFGEAKL